MNCLKPSRPRNSVVTAIGPATGAQVLQLLLATARTGQIGERVRGLVIEVELVTLARRPCP